jgi:hypothetical protein
VRKLPRTNLDPEPPRRKERRRAVVAILLGLTLSPFIFEGSAQCAAKWRAMYGPAASVKTPALDVVGSSLVYVASAFKRPVMDAVRYLPWRPRVIIPLACAWALFGCLLLRRR